MADITVSYKIVGENELAPSLKSAQSQVGNLSASFGGLFGNIGKIGLIAGAFNAVTAVVGTVISGVKSLAAAMEEPIAAASEQEDAINSLNYALAGLGKYSEAASEDMQAFATQMQNTTRFADETILKNAALISTLGKLSGTALKQATKAAADLSAALRIDLGTASEMVAKAANGQTTAFTRLGLEIKKGSTDAETFANAMAAINRSFGGRAEADVNTYSGALAKLKNTWGEVQESVGNIIIQNPVLIALFKELAGVFNILNDYLKANAKEFSNWFSTIIIFSTDVVAAILGVADNIKQGFGAAISFVQSAFSIFIAFFTSGLEKLVSIAEKIPGIGPKLAPLRQELQYFSQAFAEGGIKKFSDAWSQMSTTGGLMKASNKVKEISTNLQSIKDKGDINVTVVQNTKVKVQDFDILKELISQINGSMANFKQNMAKEIPGMASDLASSLGKGAEGARGFISGAIGTVAGAMFGPLGKALGPISDLLMQGPEKTRQMVSEFGKAVPQLIANLIMSIPVLVEELLNMLPNIVEGFVALIPGIIQSVISALPRVVTALLMMWPRVVSSIIRSVPTIIGSLITEIVRGVPNIIMAFIQSIPMMVASIAGALWDAITGIFDNFNPFGGDDGGFLGFATGGTVKSITGGVPGVDSVPAKLMEGEVVIDRSLTARLDKFLGGSGSGSSMTDSLLLELLSEIRQTRNISVTAEVNKKAFADIILELNRNNARLS